jgi:hypothetical protein
LIGVQETYPSFHYTSLIYLANQMRDFTGGRFVFIDSHMKVCFQNIISKKGIIKQFLEYIPISEVSRTRPFSKTFLPVSANSQTTVDKYISSTSKRLFLYLKLANFFIYSNFARGWLGWHQLHLSLKHVADPDP